MTAEVFKKCLKKKEIQIVNRIIGAKSAYKTKTREWSAGAANDAYGYVNPEYANPEYAKLGYAYGA